MCNHESLLSAAYSHNQSVIILNESSDKRYPMLQTAIHICSHGFFLLLFLAQRRPRAKSWIKCGPKSGPSVPTTLINATVGSDVSLRAYFRGSFCFEQLPSLNSAASQLQSVKHASLQASTVPRGNGTVWPLLVKLQIRLSFWNSRVAETLPLGFKIGIIDDEVTGVEHGGSRCSCLKIGDKSVFFVLLREQKSLLEASALGVESEGKAPRGGEPCGGVGGWAYGRSQGYVGYP
ncbi:hypothetical protein MUK42_33906 [Musa troglodytarum]|uniref:Uncharacterized protein n=1 Tax=Musa troglodytarum TaxID=320322 RepID=A0A9E7G6V6_9LILI|nr:hypothetical protein MUK42_33906 [Musa troglodytarum]